MLRLKKILVGALVAVFAQAGMAGAQSADTEITLKRNAVIQQYVKNLAAANYQSMVMLFQKNGYVVSTSRGQVDAKEFFSGFLPAIQSATTEIHQVFNGVDSDRRALRFHFAYQLKSGEKGEGEYIDEFVFVPQSEKLAAVYMFENEKFPVKDLSDE